MLILFINNINKESILIKTIVERREVKSIHQFKASNTKTTKIS